jgi:ribosomal protein S18 acetylase RimI-like enzyme
LIDVRRAVPDEWAEVREIRLRALADSPFAFASTLQREQAFGEADWRARLGNGHSWLCRSAGRAVGLVSSFSDEAHPSARHLVSMWVAPGHRGTSAASLLVDAVVEQASSDGAEAVVLWVADGNLRARRFYERLGFRPTGVRQPLPSNPDVGEELLRRSLAA